MTIEEFVFQKVHIDREKLIPFGFRTSSGSYIYKADFCDDEFLAILTVDGHNHISGSVIEKETGDEFLPLRVKDAAGEFVHHVRDEYGKLLKEVAVHIGIPVPFQSDQANRIALKIMERYGGTPDFPWKESEAGSETAGYGVFRHTDNEKWYALIMYIDETRLKTEEEKIAAKKAVELEKQRRAEERRKREEAKKAGKKLPPIKKAGHSKPDPENIKKVNIVNLKIRPEERRELWKENGIYPSFHMNQKSWISILLDDSLPDDRVMELVADSYRLTAKSGTRHQRADGRKVWIVPANPKYYDIVSEFSATDDTVWKQGKGIQTGDTVYMYVAVPYSAILYRCTVTQAHSAAAGRMELMDIHIDERYPEDLCTLEKMKQFHVTTVRGPRFMPENLEAYIREHK